MSTPTTDTPQQPYLAQLLKAHQGLDPAAVLLEESAAARCLEQRPKTLESWRRQGRGPRFLKLGRTIRYRLVDILHYLEESTHHTQRAAMTRADRHPQEAA
jgi:hypothetical protein